uniref:hypothetical protein n=1 Tax=Enterocloster aldenensis TaxID=358742 RepID=UPI00140A289B
MGGSGFLFWLYIYFFWVVVCDGGHEWLAGQDIDKLIVSGGGEVGGLMQSGDGC